MLEKVHRALKYREPLGDSTEGEYRNPPKVRDLEFAGLQVNKSIKLLCKLICAKDSLAIFHQNPK